MEPTSDTPRSLADLAGRLERQAQMIASQDRQIEQQRHKIEYLEDFVEWTRPHWPLGEQPRQPPFYQFQKLPPEIRLKIWRFAAVAEPRVILVGAETSWDCKEKHCFPNSTAPPKCRFPRVGQFFDAQFTSAPPLLGVCHDARNMAVQEYDYCLGTLPRVSIDAVEDGLEAEWEDGTLMNPRIPRSLNFSLGVNFRPSIDTVYLIGPAVRKVLWNARPQELVTWSIKYLAIEEELCRDRRLWHHMFVGKGGDPPLFRELKNLSVIVGRRPWGEGSFFPMEAAALKVFKKRIEDDFRTNHLSPPRLTLLNRGALPEKESAMWEHQQVNFWSMRFRNGLSRHRRLTKEIFAAGYDPATTEQDDPTLRYMSYLLARDLDEA